MAEIMKMTAEGLEKLKEELEYLKTVKRKEVVEAIRVALSYGDLSENSEYDEAKTEQGKVESRIIELEEMLKHVVVISDQDIGTDVVNIGTVVLVHDVEFDEDVEYIIVGSTEADAVNMKISDQSPIGRALIGMKVGDVVAFETPGGEAHLEVLKISRQK